MQTYLLLIFVMLSLFGCNQNESSSLDINNIPSVDDEQNEQIYLKAQIELIKLQQNHFNYTQLNLFHLDLFDTNDQAIEMQIQLKSNTQEIKSMSIDKIAYHLQDANKKLYLKKTIMVKDQILNLKKDLLLDKNDELTLTDKEILWRADYDNYISEEITARLVNDKGSKHISDKIVIKEIINLSYQRLLDTFVNEEMYFQFLIENLFTTPFKFELSSKISESEFSLHKISHECLINELSLKFKNIYLEPSLSEFANTTLDCQQILNDEEITNFVYKIGLNLLKIENESISLDEKNVILKAQFEYDVMKKVSQIIINEQIELEETVVSKLFLDVSKIIITDTFTIDSERFMDFMNNSLLINPLSKDYNLQYVETKFKSGLDMKCQINYLEKQFKNVYAEASQMNFYESVVFCK